MQPIQHYPPSCSCKRKKEESVEFVQHISRNAFFFFFHDEDDEDDDGGGCCFSMRRRLHGVV